MIGQLLRATTAAADGQPTASRLVVALREALASEAAAARPLALAMAASAPGGRRGAGPGAMVGAGPAHPHGPAPAAMTAGASCAGSVEASGRCGACPLGTTSVGKIACMPQFVEADGPSRFIDASGNHVGTMSAGKLDGNPSGKSDAFMLQCTEADNPPRVIGASGNGAGTMSIGVLDGNASDMNVDSDDSNNILTAGASGAHVGTMSIGECKGDISNKNVAAMSQCGEVVDDETPIIVNGMNVMRQAAFSESSGHSNVIRTAGMNLGVLNPSGVHVGAARVGKGKGDISNGALPAQCEADGPLRHQREGQVQTIPNSSLPSPLGYSGIEPMELSVMLALQQVELEKLLVIAKST